MQERATHARNIFGSSPGGQEGEDRKQTGEARDLDSCEVASNTPGYLLLSDRKCCHVVALLLDDMCYTGISHEPVCVCGCTHTHTSMIQIGLLAEDQRSQRAGAKPCDEGKLLFSNVNIYLY